MADVIKYGVIYKLTSPSGRVYVGQTMRLKSRLRCYNNGHCKNQTKLYNSLKKYGFSNHIFEILIICPDFLLNVFEAHYIQDFDCINSGLNISTEQFGYRTTEVKNNISVALSGRKLSEETKLKISISNTGKHFNDRRDKLYYPRKTQMIPVIRVSKTGEEKTYESLLSVEIDGFSSVTVGRVCKGDKYRHTHKGFLWKYLNKAV